jgi:acyl-CoA thioesterase-1
MNARALLALISRFGAVSATLLLCLGAAQAASVVALGASNTYGKGVGRGQSFPSQLEAILRANGHPVRVINAGVNGDTTAGMLSRLRAMPNDTKVVILQPGGNDRRRGSDADRGSNISRIQSELNARGIKVVLLENQMFRGLPHQPDGVHLTADGYRMLAQSLAPQVEAALK